MLSDALVLRLVSGDLLPGPGDNIWALTDDRWLRRAWAEHRVEVRQQAASMGLTAWGERFEEVPL